MLSFTEWMAIKVLTGEKTQTRRHWSKRRCVPGSIHWAQMHWSKPDTRFARLEILDVWRWDGETLSIDDVIKEGFIDHDHFRDAYAHLNNLSDTIRNHYAIEFNPIAGGYGGNMMPIDEFRRQFVNYYHCKRCKIQYLMLDPLRDEFPHCYECDYRNFIKTGHAIKTDSNDKNSLY